MKHIPILNVCVLNKTEALVWESICNKAEEGKQKCKIYNIKQRALKNNVDYYCPPWVEGLTGDESLFLHTLYETVFPGEYFVDPLGGSQIEYCMYNKLVKKIWLWKH